MAAAMSQLRAGSAVLKAQNVRPGFIAPVRADVRPFAYRLQPAAVSKSFTASVGGQARLSRGALQVVASSAEDKVKSLDRKSRSVDLAVETDTRADWTHLIAVAGFAAYWFNKITVDRLLLLKVLAYLQIFVAVTNLVTRIGTLDKVTTIIGPAVLATFVLNFQVSFLDAATGLFGYYLSEQVTGPFWLWVATLAAALYYGYGTLWYTVVFGLVALGKFVRAIKDEDKVPLLAIPAVAASAWAVYTERHFVWTLLLYIAQALWSGFSTVEKLTAKVEN